MSASPESSPTNGHVSPVANPVAVQLLDPDPSDSDLSDVQPPYVSPSSESADNFNTNALDGPADDSDEASSPSENDASDDGDFDDDVADSPAYPRSNDGLNEAAASASDDSRTASKRKAALGSEEDYIRENPELYGLRRSVSQPVDVLQVVVLTTSLDSATTT